MKKRLLPLLLILGLLLCGCETSLLPVQTLPPEPVTGDTLTVHFIDVGQADCALLECGGEYMLIDGGNRDDSQLVIAYLEQQGVQELAAVVCTHAHEDHVGGLPAVLAVYPTAAVYAPTTTYSSKIFDDFLYYTDQQGLSVTIPDPGDALTLGGTDLTVLGPTRTYAEPNDTSIVLMAQFGANRFLFTGDMETAAETDMLDFWEGRVDWNVDVLKSGHHGSSTSSGYRFIYETDPEYAVISCGKDNSYGHPHREVVELYRDADITMLRTDQLGTIVAVSDGETVAFTWGNQSAQPGDLEVQTLYIGNRNSKVFHMADCSGLPAEKNRVEFESYDDAIAAGFIPCGNCLE